MRRNSLLGAAAVAGVLLFTPVLAVGHSGVGPCADCHVMHDSQDGAPVNASGPQGNLLKFNCIGCHAFGSNSAATGRSAVGIAAPQVGPLASSGAQISGGYFSVGAGEYSQTHNVADLFPANSGADTLIAGGVSPGGAFALDAGSGAPLLRCESCHDRTITHAPADSVRAGNATSSYRMLGRSGQYVSGTGGLTFEAGADQNAYHAESMNRFCATCHGTFHGWSGNGWTGTDSDGNGVGPWIRHPTNVSTSLYPSINYNGSNKVVPVGDAGGTNLVMCISCHRPHGNANADMLRFNYAGADNAAGDATASLGCETCHGVM